MTLELRNVTKRVGADMHIHETSLVLEEGAFNMLLGPHARRQDHADAADGRPRAADVGRNLVRRPERHRRSRAEAQRVDGLPAIHQLPEFHRLREHRLAAARGRLPSGRDRRAASRKAAELLQLDADAAAPARASSPAASSSAPPSPARSSRTPTSSCSTSRWPISTTSCARNCATSCRSFSPAARCIVVYATTEPTEALLFGGNTATLHEGRVTQFGPTAEIYRKPADLVTRQGLFRPADQHRRRSIKRGEQHPARRRGQLAGRQAPQRFPTAPTPSASGPHHITPQPQRPGECGHRGPVLVTELTGSESVVHFDLGGQTWVSQSHGIHPLRGRLERHDSMSMSTQGLFFDAEKRRVAEGA